MWKKVKDFLGIEVLRVNGDLTIRFNGISVVLIIFGFMLVGNWLF